MQTINLSEKTAAQKCLGERYIGCGSRSKTLELYGTPGNALGAYLDGSEIILYGNAQDATGDTMNQGRIVIHGRTGDAAGYAMRGGELYVRDSAGYRAGIHMKAYRDKNPVIVIGGECGSFLGEYQAGGTIIVLGLGLPDGKPPVGSFCGTGMHGGRIYLKCSALPDDLPAQVRAEKAVQSDIDAIIPYLNGFEGYFGGETGFSASGCSAEDFFVLTPDTKNPYRQLYVGI